MNYNLPNSLAIIKHSLENSLYSTLLTSIKLNHNHVYKSHPFEHVILNSTLLSSKNPMVDLLTKLRSYRTIFKLDYFLLLI